MLLTLTPLDTTMLRCYYIYNTVGRADAKESIDNIRKQAIYNVRQYRHNANVNNIHVPEELIEKKVWSDFIKEEIETGKTTGIIAQEHCLPLEKVNSYMW